MPVSPIVDAVSYSSSKPMSLSLSLCIPFPRISSLTHSDWIIIIMTQFAYRVGVRASPLVKSQRSWIEDPHVSWSWIELEYSSLFQYTRLHYIDCSNNTYWLCCSMRCEWRTLLPHLCFHRLRLDLFLHLPFKDEGNVPFARRQRTRLPYPLLLWTLCSHADVPGATQQGIRCILR